MARRYLLEERGGHGPPKINCRCLRCRLTTREQVALHTIVAMHPQGLRL
jgi:hypothetical protein